MAVREQKLILDDYLVRICRKLQLNPTQYDLAVSRYTAIGNWLESEKSPLVQFRPVIYPQGSLRIATTVKPKIEEIYDLDLVCEFQAMDCAWIQKPTRLIEDVFDWLGSNKLYENKIQKKNRCVRVIYKPDFHLDILPACPDKSLFDGCIRVPDRKEQGWKASNPKGFAKWFEGRTKVQIQATERMDLMPKQVDSDDLPPLKRAIQLMKRHRNIYFADKDDKFLPVSIVITTLAAQCYRGENTVASALTGILEKILFNFPTDGPIPIVLNPSNPLENLSERWNENPELFKHFTLWLIDLNRMWVKVRQEEGEQREETLKSLFGESVVMEVVRDRATEAVQKINSLRDDGSLSVKSTTGVLGSASQTPSTLIIPRHNFYGG